jgi:hypothetical protein
MKRTAVALTLILALLTSTATGTLLVNVAKANYYPPPSIEIYSPPFPTSIHANTSVPLNVRVNILPSEPDITYIRYSIDGKANVTISNLARENNMWYWTTTEGVLAQGTAFTAKATMDNLSEGNHTLIVYAHYANGKEMCASREFTVDTQYKPYTPPELIILSPKNKTYTTAEVPLTFTINETVLSVYCRLDRKPAFPFLSGDIELKGNSTLKGLSNGMHELTVTVWTEKWWESQTIYFTINIDNENASTTNNPNPTIPAVAAGSIGATAAVGFGILVYFKKRKHQKRTIQP